MMEDIPKAVEKALLPDEKIRWIGRPERLPQLLVTILIFFLTFGVLFIFLLFVLPLLKGDAIVMNGEELTFSQALPPTLITVVSLTGFAYLWLRQFKSVRYIVTNVRAFIYRPTWGVSYKFGFSTGFKLKRDYTNFETSPISGGYFTTETYVEISGSDEYGTLKIFNLNSQMQDAGIVASIKTIFPSLDGIIYDPANLIFAEVKEFKIAEIKIHSAIKEKNHE